jgi:hypothetical protein
LAAEEATVALFGLCPSFLEEYLPAAAKVAASFARQALLRSNPRRREPMEAASFVALIRLTVADHRIKKRGG